MALSVAFEKKFGLFLFFWGFSIPKNKKIEEKNSVKPVLAGLEMKAQAGQKIGQ